MDANTFGYIFIFILNYFWLSDDPVECASWYCDQHCFKLGSEVIESVWDAVLVLCPKLSEMADEAGIPSSNRQRRHSRKDGLWHPFSVWNGFCRSNMHRSLINADAIFAEHERRTGKKHSAWTDCKFLMENIEQIDFNSKQWVRWFFSQNGSTSKYTPSKTKPIDVERRKQWCKEMGLSYKKSVDRNTMPMTLPGQYINEKIKAFAGCKVQGNDIQSVIKAYRAYYVAKATTVKGGMRYYYSYPPFWLRKVSEAKLLTTPKAKRKTKIEVKYARDSEGFVIVKFVN